MSQELMERLQNMIWQLHGSGDCERCKAKGQTSKAPMVTLGGELEASVCDLCIRDWDDLCDSSDEWKDLVLAEGEVDAVRHLIENGKDLRSTLKKALTTRLEAKIAVRKLAQAWLAEKE